MKWRFGIVAAIVTVAILTGCERQRWVEIQSGTYSQIRGSDEISDAAAGEIAAVIVERQQETVTILFKDGAQLTTPFTIRERTEWPAGCPTNLIMHRLEIVELDTDVLRIGELSVQRPVLIRNCPAVPEQLILREDATFDGGGTVANEGCLVISQE